MIRIHRLPEELVGKIAAGEVVERPASVVKELVENALDAGAGEIEIELAAGGKGRIYVRDDGHGMSPEDVLLALEPHATSKIAGFDDLLRIRSLGFRGEALASIAAVSRVDLQSAEEPGDGCRVLAEPGREPQVEPISRPRGTSVEVSSLFFNVPARRGFLKTDSTELRKILEVVQGYALSRPEVRFSVRHEERQLLEALPAGKGAKGARRRIGQIFGDSLVETLSEIEFSEQETHLWGFVGDRSTTRGRRYFVFVNRRLIRDRQVMSSFYRAVRDVWKSSDFPALFLFIDLPPAAVDVNVHPQKSEVRFRESRALHLVYKAVRAALEGGLAEGLAPLTAPPAGDPSAWAPLSWKGEGGRYRRAGGQAYAAPGAGSEIREGSQTETPGKLAEAVYAPLDRPVVPLSGRDGESRSFRLLGQYKGTLILLEGPDGLYLVDQHVAHERILYERLRSELAREQPQSQRLLQPALMELSAAEAARLREWIPQLERCGFELTSLSQESIGITAVPTVLQAKEAEKLLEQLTQSVAAEEPDSLRSSILDALAASMACRSAVKMHEPMSADKMEAVIAELFAAEQPYACPHGRPTILKMSDADLERRFGRR